MTATKTEAIRQANAELNNAGLPTYSELLSMLIDAQRLGLDFAIGTAYIRRSYIDEQTSINARIQAAKDAALAAALAA